MKGRLGIDSAGRQTIKDGENVNNFLARVFKRTELLMDELHIQPGSVFQHWSTGNVPAGEFILRICVSVATLGSFCVCICCNTWQLLSAT